MAPATTHGTEFELNLPKAAFGTRWLTALGIAIVTSLAFFWLMYAVIHVSGHGVDKIETLPTIDFVRLKRDAAPEQTERRKPPPPPPARSPAPPSKMTIDVETAAPSADIGIPTDLNLSASVAPAGGGGGAVAASFDSDLIPLQRIPPTYPAEARRAGVNGWVQIDVTVNPDGSVRKARVVEAKPKGLFEAAAVTAVQKWRFRPKTVDGKAVEFHGLQRIEFNLSAAE